MLRVYFWVLFLGILENYFNYLNSVSLLTLPYIQVPTVLCIQEHHKTGRGKGTRQCATPNKIVHWNTCTHPKEPRLTTVLSKGICSEAKTVVILFPNSLSWASGPHRYFTSPRSNVSDSFPTGCSVWVKQLRKQNSKNLFLKELNPNCLFSLTPQGQKHKTDLVGRCLATAEQSQSWRANGRSLDLANPTSTSHQWTVEEECDTTLCIQLKVTTK